MRHEASHRRGTLPGATIPVIDVAGPSMNDDVAGPSSNADVGRPMNEDVAGPSMNEDVAGPSMNEDVAGPSNILEDDVATAPQDVPGR